MTREEAINEIKSWDFLEGKEIEAIHTLIPELRESEDERIIKKLQEYVKNRNWALNGPTQAEVLAWLEKQKNLISYYEDKLDRCACENLDKGIKAVLNHPEEYGLEKQKEQKLRKFKLGDKVHWYDDDTNIITITGFRDDAYLTDSAYGPILFCEEDNWEKIEQKPIECIDFYDEFHKLYTGPRDILAYVNIFVKKLGHVPIDIDELSACVHYVIKHKEEDIKAMQKEQKSAELSVEDEDMTGSH